MTVADAAPRAASSEMTVDLDRLLKPRSIAIVGAQPEPTSIGGGVLANLEAFGYSGRIHLVSRSRDEIRGRPCVKAIADLPKGIDVAVLIVPQAAILDSVRACAERGIGAVVVFASGFAEAGDEGRQQQDELARLCADSGIALLGPNCMGYTNYPDGIPLTFEPVDFRPLAAGGRRVAVVAQSGATAANIRFAMHARGIDVSYVIATGNEATYYFDPDYFLEIRVITKSWYRGSEFEGETDLGDYERVNGVYFPFSVASGAKGASQKSTISYDKGEANVDLDDALFAFPGGKP